MKDFVLGIDGGTTKTGFALFTSKGDYLDYEILGGTNYELIPDGFEGLRRILNKRLPAFLKRNDLTPENISSAVFGMSGVDSDLQNKTITKMFEDLHFSNFTVCNDAFLGILAGARQGYGVCSVNGTGCTVCGMDPLGNRIQIGGTGDLTGDFGGGDMVGRFAVKAVYDSIFRGAPSTILKDVLFNYFHIQQEDHFIEIVNNKYINGQVDISIFCPAVFEAANQGDRVALDFLKQMGKETALSLRGAIERLQFSNTIPVVLTGSVNVKGANRTHVNFIKSYLTKHYPNKTIEFKVLKVPPVSGAVIWALNGLHNHNEYYEKVIEQMQNRKD